MTGLCSACYKESRSFKELFPHQPNTEPLCKKCFKLYCNMQVPVYLAAQKPLWAKSLFEFSNSAPHKVTGFQKHPDGTPKCSQVRLASQVDHDWVSRKEKNLIVEGRCSRCQGDSNSLTEIFPGQPLTQPLCDRCLEAYTKTELSVYLSRYSTKAKSFSEFARSMAHKVTF